MDPARVAVYSRISCSIFTIHADIPDNLTATERRPTYIVVEWAAPPSPFSGNYRLTYGVLDEMNTSTIVNNTSYNITGLQPNKNYRVTVQASYEPGAFGPPLSEVFATLPDAAVPPGEMPPTITVPEVRTGSSSIVNIVIPPPTFDQSQLRYIS